MSGPGASRQPDLGGSAAVNVTVAPSHNSLSQTVITSTGKTVRPTVFGVAQPPGTLQPLISALQAITKKQEDQLKTLQGKPATKPVNLNVKIINPEKKSVSETYVMRDLSCETISTPSKLIKEIAEQFGELVPSDLKFPVGYFKGTTKVWIRSENDIQDVWSFINKGENVSLWCHGVSESSRMVEVVSSENEEDYCAKKPKRKRRRKSTISWKEKNDNVEELVTELRQKHGDRFTTIQYRLWAEMVDVGTYKYV